MQLGLACKCACTRVKHVQVETSLKDLYLYSRCCQFVSLPQHNLDIISDHNQLSARVNDVFHKKNPRDSLE